MSNAEPEPITKIFNKGFISITLVNFVVYFVYFLLMAIIAVIAHQQLHASFGQSGLASGIFVVGTLAARLIMGQQLELLGRKAVLRYGALFYLVTTIAYLFIPNIGVMYIVRLLNGFAYGMTSTATNAIVTAYIPENQKGKGINYYGLSTALAAALGPFMGMILLNYTTFKTIIIMSIIMIAVVAVSAFVLHVDDIKLTAEKRTALKKITFSAFVETKVIFISFIGFLIGFAFSSVLSFLSSYAAQLNLLAISSFFFIVYAGVIAISRPISGTIFDTKGENAVMYPTYFALTIGLIMLSYTTTGWMLLLSGAFIGLGYGTFLSNGQAIALKLSPSVERIGVSLSTYFIGVDLGLGVGPFILGQLHNGMSFSKLYLSAAIIPMVAMVLYFFFYKPKHVGHSVHVMDQDGAGNNI
ncbi:MFS transporter [Periweissella cryptocerci]|uniref:MFS transporter n=1 Tax=Periweissella cryptocerci TaxID=2506420 RepID=A0A4V1AIQ4_9LACO|nr:MFS transporter [Periweissella cryptocerci]QBO36315.1 MFS transporter [Periweissella cryptocerci]